MSTYGSLFSGAGVWDHGLESELPGLRCSFQVERNPDALRILAHHWPGVPRITDIKQARGVDLPRVDGLIGGIPCDGISTARTTGERGIESGNTNLWIEADRLVGELSPAWCMWESSAKDRAWSRWVPVVRRDLWTRRYASVSFRVRAHEHGAAHGRDRAFVVGWKLPSDPDRQGEPPRAVHATLARLRATPVDLWDGRVPTRAHGRLAHGLDQRLATRIGFGVDRRAARVTARVIEALIGYL